MVAVRQDHESHGLHLHALVNKYLPVRVVRAAVEGYQPVKKPSFDLNRG